jgi:chemotaxis protein CheC
MVEQRLTGEMRRFAAGLCSAATQQASIAVGRLMQEKVWVSHINSGLFGISTLSEMTGDPENEAVGVYVRVDGQASGHAVFLFPYREAPALVSALGFTQLEENGELGVEATSALQELGNILISSALTGLANETGLTFRPSPPAAAVDMAWSIISSIVAIADQVDDRALIAAMQIGTMAEPVLDGLFVFIPDAGSLWTILGSHALKSPIQGRGSAGSTLISLISDGNTLPMCDAFLQAEHERWATEYFAGRPVLPS